MVDELLTEYEEIERRYNLINLLEYLQLMLTKEEYLDLVLFNKLPINFDQLPEILRTKTLRLSDIFEEIKNDD